MALQDICELNSILNVEDEEKIQLTKLKEKISSTINQQERRVSWPIYNANNYFIQLYILHR